MLCLIDGHEGRKDMKGGRTRREEGHEDREDTKGGHVIDPNHLSLLPLMTNCPPQWLALNGYLLKKIVDFCWGKSTGTVCKDKTSSQTSSNSTTLSPLMPPNCWRREWRITQCCDL